MFEVNNKKYSQPSQLQVESQRVDSANEEMSAALKRISSVLHHVATSAFQLTGKYRIHKMDVFLSALDLPTMPFSVAVTQSSSSLEERHSSRSLLSMPTMPSSSSSMQSASSSSHVTRVSMELTDGSSSSSSSARADQASSHSQEVGCAMDFSASAKRSFSTTTNSRSSSNSDSIDSLFHVFHSQSLSSDLSERATSTSRGETQNSASPEEASCGALHFSSGEQSLSQDQTVASQNVSSNSSSSVFSVLRDSRDNFFETSLESSNLSRISPHHIEEAMKKVFGKTGYELDGFVESGPEELRKSIFSYFYFWILVTPQEFVNFKRSSEHYHSAVKVVRQSMRNNTKFAEKFYQCWNLIQTLSRNAT